VQTQSDRPDIRAPRIARGELPADGVAAVTESTGEVTRLLVAVRDGDSQANARLMEMLQTELSRLARRYMRSERVNHTLQPTALVNEAYIRLLGRETPSWQNRAHFLAHAARAMRQILVDHARANRTDKRGGKEVKISIETARTESDRPLAETLAGPARSAEVIALNEALDELSTMDARQAHVVELRFFGGLAESEIAELLGVTVRTVRRDWSTARLWLQRRMKGGGDAP
jgi:RNA polymerase sigma-70 factor, ECF subfamily